MLLLNITILIKLTYYFFLIQYIIDYKEDVEVDASVCCDWLRNATLEAFNLAVFPLENNVPGYGDMLGVEQWLLLRSHWSSNRNSSSAVGPPFGIGSMLENMIIKYCIINVEH